MYTKELLDRYAETLADPQEKVELKKRAGLIEFFGKEKNLFAETQLTDLLKGTAIEDLCADFKNKCGELFRPSDQASIKEENSRL